jgi:ribosomal protein S2
MKISWSILINYAINEIQTISDRNIEIVSTKSREEMNLAATAQRCVTPVLEGRLGEAVFN